MRILHGYANSELSEEIEKRLLDGSKHIVTENITRASKIGIEKAVYDFQPDIIILSEFMPSGNYTADEITWLKEKQNVRIIPLLTTKHKGTDYLKKLFREGIYDALFIDEIKNELLPTLIVTQIINKRGQSAARQIYGI